MFFTSICLCEYVNTNTGASGGWNRALESAAALCSADVDAGNWTQVVENQVLLTAKLSF